MNREQKEVKRGVDTPIIWGKPVNEFFVDSEGNPMREPLLDEVKFIGVVTPTIFRGVASSTKTMSVIYHGIKAGYEVYKQPCSEDMTRVDLLGSLSLVNNETVLLASPMLTALKRSSEGAKVLILFDEINLLSPSVLKSINGIMDEQRGLVTEYGTFRLNESSTVVGTMNIEYDSAGYDLDPQLRSRALIIDVNLNKAIDKLVKETRSEEGARKYKIKLGASAGEIIKQTNGAVGLRELTQMLSLVNKLGMTVEEALEVVLMKYEGESRRKIKEIVKLNFGVSKE